LTEQGWQAVEKRHERRPDKAKFNEKRRSYAKNEHFEEVSTLYDQAQ
jgi:hypothetical protein